MYLIDRDRNFSRRNFEFLQLLILSGAMLFTAMGCTPANEGKESSQSHPKDLGMHEANSDTNQSTAKFLRARQDPRLVRGEVLPLASFDCDGQFARTSNGKIYVRVVRPTHGRGGFIHVVVNGGGSAYFSADFVEADDQDERILVLTGISEDVPGAKSPELRGQLLTDVADLVQTIHEKCFSTPFRKATSYLLLTPEITHS